MKRFYSILLCLFILLFGIACKTSSSTSSSKVITAPLAPKKITIKGKFYKDGTIYTPYYRATLQSSIDRKNKRKTQWTIGDLEGRFEHTFSLSQAVDTLFISALDCREVCIIIPYEIPIEGQLDLGEIPLFEDYPGYIITLQGRSKVERRKVNRAGKRHKKKYLNSAKNKKNTAQLRSTTISILDKEIYFKCSDNDCLTLILDLR